MSVGSKIVNVRFEDAFMDRIHEEIERRNEASREAPWSLSDYIRNAVREKIAHADRSRGQKRVRKFVCAYCGERMPFTKVGYTLKPLFGPKETTCVYCMSVKPAGI